MNIAISTIYGNLYTEDKLFDNTTCAIGENLLMPNIKLKTALEDMGHALHTIDMYKARDIDKVLFQDIPSDSLLAISRWRDLFKYVIKAKWRKDYLLKAVIRLPKSGRFLQINEPPTVAPISYTMKMHRYFEKVLTWNDALVDGKKYLKFYIPQYLPSRIFSVPYKQKKMLTMIVGNKTSVHQNELYSERKKVIQYFEGNLEAFDLYGFGWEKENYKNYKGLVEKKLETLSQYKFCVCFENITGITGYITEKMFDCFFAGCVPIYWGADNVTDYIPEDAFIDMRKFQSIENMCDFIKNIDEAKYEEYLKSAQNYLKGEKFEHTFSTASYVKRCIQILIGEDGASG